MDCKTENDSLPFAKWIFGVLATGAVIAALVFGATQWLPLRVSIAYVALAALGLVIYLVVEFSRRGPGPVPLVLLLAGWAFAVGGIVFDVAITIAKTPDLALENNAVVRAFLAWGYSVSYIRAFGLMAQIGLAALACVAWLGFLRHRCYLVAQAWALRPANFNEFSNAAVRGVLRPVPLLSPSGITLPRFSWYRLACLLLVAWVGGQSIRWYYGFDWLGLLPFHHVLFRPLLASTGVVYFYVWLGLEYRKGVNRAA